MHSSAEGGLKPASYESQARCPTNSTTTPIYLFTVTITITIRYLYSAPYEIGQWR